VAPGSESPVLAAPEAAAGPPAPGEGVAPQGTLRFTGAYLLTSGPEGPIAVPDLVLALGETGVALTKADGTAVWSANWDGITGLSTPERSRLPDGGHGVVVVITEGSGRSHRFVVAAGRCAPVESALDSMARRHGASSERPERSLPVLVVVAVVVVLGVAVAVLLLDAGHIINL